MNLIFDVYLAYDERYSGVCDRVNIIRPLCFRVSPVAETPSIVVFVGNGCQASFSVVDPMLL